MLLNSGSARFTPFYMTRTKKIDLNTWPQTYMAQNPLRSKSVVMTLFGDVILPHGGALWLGSLIRLLAPFGISDRLVRTSVYRLVEEGWLSAQRQGRRSMYTLRSSAVRRFEHAYKRVYTPSYLAWDGEWTHIMTLPGMLSTRQRSQLRKELLWEGFGALSPTAFIHPSPDVKTLTDLLTRLQLRNGIFISSMTPSESTLGQSFSELIKHCWDLDTITADYEHFLRWFSPLPDLIRAQPVIDSELAFVLRTLLIHAFRRVQLHDPQLPIDLLPANWAGKAAYELCRDLYCLLYRKADEHALTVLRLEDENAPEAEPSFYERFGGLS